MLNYRLLSLVFAPEEMVKAQINPAGEQQKQQGTAQCSLYMPTLLMVQEQIRLYRLFRSISHLLVSACPDRFVGFSLHRNSSLDISWTCIKVICFAVVPGAKCTSHGQGRLLAPEWTLLGAKALTEQGCFSADRVCMSSMFQKRVQHYGNFPAPWGTCWAG